MHEPTVSLQHEKRCLLLHVIFSTYLHIVVDGAVVPQDLVDVGLHALADGVQRQHAEWLLHLNLKYKTMRVGG
jgi:hypothetical protein